MNIDELLKLWDESQDMCKSIMVKKNHDYTGGENIFRNFKASEILGIDARKSLLIRVMDKIQRLNTFIDKGELLVDNESVHDAVYDIMNYMILLLGLIKSGEGNT